VIKSYSDPLLYIIRVNRTPNPQDLRSSIPVPSNLGCQWKMAAIKTRSDVPATQRSTLGDRALAVAGPRAWNNLPDTSRHSTSMATFKRTLKIHLFPAVFLPRDAMRKRCLCCGSVSACPSICPSRSCIVSRRLKISSNCFLSPISPSL